MLEYRLMTALDIEAYIALRVRQLREEGATEDVDLAPALRDYYDRHLSDDTFRAWLAVEDGRIVATSGMSLAEKPPYSPPYIHQTESGKRVSFQTWDWENENYRLVQYIIEDGETLSVSKYDCAYRAVRRAELTELLYAAGCGNVTWKMPEDTGFYQPIVIAEK